MSVLTVLLVSRKRGRNICLRLSALSRTCQESVENLSRKGRRNERALTSSYGIDHHSNDPSPLGFPAKEHAVERERTGGLTPRPSPGHSTAMSHFPHALRAVP